MLTKSRRRTSLLLLGSFAALSAGCGEPCNDSYLALVEVTIHKADYTWEAGTWLVDFTADGTKTSISFLWDGNTWMANSSDPVTWKLSYRPDCVETAYSIYCNDNYDTQQLVIETRAKPQIVDISVHKDNVLVDSRHFQAVYVPHDFTPSSDCSSVVDAFRVDWTLP